MVGTLLGLCQKTGFVIAHFAMLDLKIQESALNVPISLKMEKNYHLHSKLKEDRLRLEFTGHAYDMRHITSFSQFLQRKFVAALVCGTQFK